MAKHFLLFNNNGVISATRTKHWARANRELFPDYTFEDGNTPTINVIEAYLINQEGYKPVSNDDIVILYKMIELG